MRLDIDLLFLEYRNNLKDAVKYNDLIRHPSPLDSWSMNVIKRSNSLRHAFVENDKILDKIKNDISLNLDDDKAKYYYDKLISLYFDAIDDYGIIKLIADYLVDFYIDKKDYDKLAMLYIILGFETLECFNRNPEYAIKSFEYYKKATELKEHYYEMKDPESRLAIFKAYYNIVGVNTVYIIDVRKQIFKYYDESIALWESINNEDKNDPRFISMNEDIKGNILSIEDYLDGLDKESINRFIEIGLAWDHKKDISGLWFLAHLKAQYLSKSKTLEEIIPILSEYFYQIPNEIDKENIDPEIILKHFNVGCDLLEYLEASNIPDKEEQIEKIIRINNQFFYSIPFDFTNNMMDFLCVTWFNVSLPHIKDIEEKETLLVNLIVERQLFTYLHSVMVSKISKLLCEYVIKKSPKYFIGFMGYKNVGQILNDKDKIISYVSKAGLFHDVGKSAITSLVNLQTRKLSKEEFALIRSHPSQGIKVLANDPYFKDFYDVILMHHIWYDGTNGYPSNIDNQKSIYKKAIDLVTIADSIDAATDIYGRNYAIPKTVDEVIDEFIEGKGTRYNPILVKLISKDIDLKNRLRELTTDDRAVIYYNSVKELEER